MALIIILQNESNLAPVSDYRAQVLVGDGTPDGSQVLYNGRVMYHKRADGWQALVKAFLNSLEANNA